MSNLASFGSKDFSPEIKVQEIQSSTDPQQNQHQAAIQQVSELFKSSNFQDQTQALKILLALISKGVDVSAFSPYVVQQIASPDPNSRQLAYIYLNHYAEEANETIMLSINTFQKSLTDSDPLCRALAVKVLSSIRSREILPAIQDAVRTVIGDPSPYVKKAAAYAMIKASNLGQDDSETESYLPLIERMLGDPSPIAFSGAIAAYYALCPDNIEFLHPHYRYICQNISKLDPWAQIYTLRALAIYARYCFKDPSSINEEETANFWDENANNDSIPTDQFLLISAAKKMLSSMNPAVSTAATSLLYYCGPSSSLSVVARPMVRLLYSSSIISQLTLTSILTLASSHPQIFVPHINHFFIRRFDTTPVKNIKLRVLSLLASQTSAELILNELSRYASSTDTDFAVNAVKTMGKTALCNESIIPACLVSLIKLLGRSEGPVLSEVVVVISHLLFKRRGTEDEAMALRQLCRKFDIVKDPTARAAVLSIVGDLYETHKAFAPQLLRYVGQNFSEEPGEVRLQALTLAAKLVASGEDRTIPIYILKIGERDPEFDVRDRSKFLLAILESDSDDIKNNLKELLFPARKTPNWTSTTSYNSEFMIGTLSHFLNRALPGYESLPDWAPEEEIPDDSVRTPLGAPKIGGSGKSNVATKEGLKEFFDGEQNKDDDEYYSDQYYSDDPATIQ
ncbi:Adaptin N terminal region family protein [Trichomonas vaginalis G3]|uniref:Adaptin N terminal region family protein n=1 Tax=Trichomonas vaginalis (strain ATCC PRA-98 / G3) TaxID=412133 RepID=A2F8J1_TRIV3|nr:adaptor complex subunit beta family member family [Trichomonas vaginalis G3]EAX98784.1 Adaptin N terminal region family protein [Trichomonas vaginalis G3]KAI5483859.1 adaptor complex subunit beta family member family [Trichomonas vaginalis G3]|eukprot:XP_001311714.1 Adaptin N terminal region family protein [Trichomonas vaginalis G3]